MRKGILKRSGTDSRGLSLKESSSLLGESSLTDSRDLLSVEHDGFMTVLNALSRQHQEFLDRATARLGYALRRENQKLKREKEALQKEVERLRLSDMRITSPAFAAMPEYFGFEDAENTEQDKDKDVELIQGASLHPFSVPAPPRVGPRPEPPSREVEPPPLFTQGVSFPANPEFEHSGGSDSPRDESPSCNTQMLHRTAQRKSQLFGHNTSIHEARVRAQRQQLEDGQVQEPQGRLARFVYDSRFETFALCLVLFNTILIAVQTDYMARKDLVKTPMPFIFAELGFMLFYMIEVGLRVTADASAYFRGPGRVLNIFDCMLILIQMVEVTVSLATFSTDKAVNLTFLRCLKLTRAVRIGRSVKLLAALQEVRMCCVAMLMYVKPFIAACLILSLWITIISVYYTERALTRRLWLGLDHEDVPDLKKNYGTIYYTSYSLFQAITGGMDWGDLSTLLPSLPDTALFTLYISFSLLVLMNIITGVVISNIMKFAKDDELVSLLPSAEKVLKSVTREGHFREDISLCLSSSGIKVLVSGLTHKHVGANGKYIQHGEHHGRPFFLQETDNLATSPHVMYYDSKRHWCLGASIGEVLASRFIDTFSPPKGRWPLLAPLTDTLYANVQLIHDTKRVGLKELLKIMEMDHADVEAIFALCESHRGAEVDMATFLSMYVEARAPARRLEMMQLASGMDKEPRDVAHSVGRVPRQSKS